jgi:excinuclease UvrABC nuclease subunit
MNSSKVILAVHPPFPRKQLGRYRNRKGYFIIRQQDQVLYVGKSKNIWHSVLRLFEQGGKLSHLNRDRMTFEVVLSDLRSSFIKQVLINELEPQYNTRKATKRPLTYYQKQQLKKIVAAYYSQTRFEIRGNHQSDNTPSHEG